MRQLSKISSMAVLMFFMFTLGSQTAGAVTIGVSPSIIETYIRQGEQGEFEFTLSRSDANIDIPLELTLENADYITLDGEKRIVFDEGESQHKVKFTIDTTDLALGDYETEFLFQEEQYQDHAINGIAIRFGVQSDLLLHVINEADYLNRMTQTPPQVSGIYPEQPIYTSDETVELRYELRNFTDLLVTDLTRVIDIRNEAGEVVESLIFEGELNIAPGHNSSQVVELAAPEPGNYTATLEVMYQDQKIGSLDTEFAVREPESVNLVFVPIVLAGAIVFLLILAYVLRKK